MSTRLPFTEVPEFAARDGLAHAVSVLREAVSRRVGYDVELACLEPVDRDGCKNLRVHWRNSADETTSGR